MADLEFLASIPIFSFFTRPELEAAERLFREVTFAKDDVVVRLGDPGDTFYVVLDGELEVWDASRPPRQTGTLRRGDYFGEMALLQGGTRTATVTAARRVRLLAVDKPAFDHLFLRNPKAIEYFARVLSKRLAGVTRAERIRRATTAIAVASRRGLKGETLVAHALAGILRQITNTEVVYVEVRPSDEAPRPSVLDLLSGELEFAPRKWVPPNEDGRPTTLQIVVPGDLDSRGYGDLLSNLVSRLSDSFSFIVFDLGSQIPGLIESAPAYADSFVALVDAADDDPGIGDLRSMTLHRVVNLFNPTSRPIPISSSEPFVIPYSPIFAGPTVEASEFIRANPRSAPALPMFRLAHKLLGMSIGIALGGGAAFGLAHLGVLKVLEEHGVPIDLVAGCSQGSIVAVGYAAGLSIDEMIQIARELGTRRNFLFASDPTFFLKPGILSGQRFVSMMRPYLKGKESFEQLVLPCRTVATDIESGERVAIGSGSLERAYRASSSVPMVLAPLRAGERVLVDGGVADPVPAGVATEMGADITIAVNVVPPMKRGVETVLSSFYRRMNAFNPLSYFGDGQDMPNLFDIVMNSLQILQYELGNFKAISADVLINPDLSDFTWIEYYRADELIERGAAAAEKALPLIDKAIEAKLGPIRQAAPGVRVATG
ncbi:MAG TPA: patatin-like phospholipase family protein [Vicinamibacterales bacterium]|nr:patatin-like phospholipase family protein [Vicinamibacterales bacterium]